MIKKNYYNNILISILFFIPFLLCIFRPLESPDTLGYYLYFTSSSLKNVDIFNVEISFIIIAFLCKLIDNGILGFRILLFIYASITSYILFNTINRTRSPFIAFMIYFSFAYSYQMCIQIRSAITNILLISIALDLSEEKNKKAIFKILLASLFHISGLLFFIIKPLYHIFDKHRKILWLIPIVIILISISTNEYMSIILENLHKYDFFLIKRILPYYQDKYYFESVVNPLNRVSLVIIFVYYFYVINVGVNQLIKTEIISLTILNISLFSYFWGALNFPIIAQRYPESFNLILIVLFTELIRRVKEKYFYFIILFLYLAFINYQYSTINTLLAYL